jgi:hypothetical protein
MGKTFGVAKYQKMVLDALLIRDIFTHEQAVRAFKERGFYAEGKKINGEIVPQIFLLPTEETFTTSDEHGNPRQLTSKIKYKLCNYNLIRQWIVNPDMIAEFWELHKPKPTQK